MMLDTRNSGALAQFRSSVYLDGQRLRCGAASKGSKVDTVQELRSNRGSRQERITFFKIFPLKAVKERKAYLQ